MGKKLIYVDVNNHTGFEDGTSDFPFNTIQEALEAALDRDRILVAAGTYHENIDFFGKAVLLTSLSGAAETIIQGLGTGDVVTGATGAELSGFTVTGSGRKRYDCGIQAQLATMIISENVITGNWLGILTSNHHSPQIRNNLICRNIHYGVVASFYSSPLIVNNTIVLNGEHGIFSQSGTGELVNNIIFANEGYGVVCTMVSSSPRFGFNNIFRNRRGDYMNCFPGEGDISANPMLVRGAKSRFFLRPGSPCIDMGTSISAPAFDIDLEPRPQGGFIDMGCDEFHTGGTIYGFIVNRATGLPVRGAVVKCVGKGQIRTGRDGYYGFADVMNGSWPIKVSKAGYTRARRLAEVTEAGSVRLDISIKPRK